MLTAGLFTEVMHSAAFVTTSALNNEAKYSEGVNANFLRGKNKVNKTRSGMSIRIDSELS